MRLLDKVASCQMPLRLVLDRRPEVLFEVTGPSTYASQVAACPLRFVLGDDITRASAELAFADGAQLADCLDLLRIPASLMWVEWNDEMHQKVIHATGSVVDFDAAAPGRHVGVLLRASADGQRALARTFWVHTAAAESADVVLSPLETHIDLGGGFAEAAEIDGILAGGLAGITDPANPAMASLLDHVRFRFDDTWSAFYRAAATNPEAQRHVVYESLAAVARDVPLLLAFFLLLSAKEATRSIPISRVAINRKRRELGRLALLDHVEVRASLDAVQEPARAVEVDGRQSPRLHHVRGHLVRRDNRVFWRTPHLRGSASRGMVRSRTVCLSFARPHEARARVSESKRPF
ncbi:MAG: hypothetical protein ABJD53_16395 [Gammaproteobacteria bacterium]